jgi:replicative superfamily II helicase
MNVKSSGEDVGLYKLAKAMKPILEEQYSWTPDDNELLASLRKGVVLMHGDKPETIDLREIAQICVPKVYAKLFDSIEAYWGNARSMHVLISSGGGHYILDHLKKRFPHAALLNKPKRGKEKEALNDAIFDVVDGYAIYGKAKFTQNVTHINVKTKANA